MDGIGKVDGLFGKTNQTILSHHLFWGIQGFW